MLVVSITASRSLQSDVAKAVSSSGMSSVVPALYSYVAFPLMPVFELGHGGRGGAKLRLARVEGPDESQMWTPAGSGWPAPSRPVPSRPVPSRPVPVRSDQTRPVFLWPGPAPIASQPAVASARAVLFASRGGLLSVAIT